MLFYKNLKWVIRTPPNPHNNSVLWSQLHLSNNYFEHVKGTVNIALFIFPVKQLYIMLL